MRIERFLRLAVFLGTIFCVCGTILSLFAQNTNTYLGPHAPVPGNPQLIRVQILVYDSVETGGLEIKSASFNQTDIPLKPRDIHGFRGEGTFQVPPGTYKLKWKVQRDKINWPRIVPHEETVNLDKRDLWLQITIQGETAAIT